MALNSYLSATQNLLHDTNAQFYSVAQLTTYINAGRAKTAAVGQCCRFLPTGLNTVAAQETYPVSTINALLPTQLSAVLGVITIAVNIGSSKPTLRRYTWTAFQAYLRSYSIAMQGYPMVFAQYGTGTPYTDTATSTSTATGVQIYLWPVPSAIYAMDWDCYCLPIPLVSDSTLEAIPYPFTDAVPYYAAHLALLGAQRRGDADKMKEDFRSKIREARANSEMMFIPDMYGI